MFGDCVTLKYVCCDCRQVACRRKWALTGAPVCGRCGKAMCGVGQYFKAPRKRDNKGWAAVKVFVQQNRRRAGMTQEEYRRLPRQYLFKKQ